MVKQGLLIALLCFSFQSAKAQKHVHGEGQLLIAQEQQRWQFQFLLPALDVLGFEHSPESAEQNQQLTNTIAKIEGIEDLIKLPSFCEIVSTSHSLTELSPHHSNSTHEKHSHNYVNVNVTYIFKCDEHLNAAEVSVFEWLRSLHNLNTQWITNSHQGSVELTPYSNNVRFTQ